MHTYAIGQPYNPHWTNLPETTQLFLRGGGTELLKSLRGPSMDEVRNVRKAPGRFTLLEVGGVLLITSTIGFMSGVMPCDARLKGEAGHLSAPEITHRLEGLRSSAEARIGVHLVLVSSEDGIIRTLRNVTLSSAFSRCLLGKVLEQLEASPLEGRADDAALESALERLEREGPQDFVLETSEIGA